MEKKTRNRWQLSLVLKGMFLWMKVLAEKREASLDFTRVKLYTLSFTYEFDFEKYRIR